MGLIYVVAPKPTMNVRANQKVLRLLAGAFVSTAFLLSPASLRAADVYKADQANVYSDGGSWVGSSAPLATDVAVWDNNNTVVSAANLTNVLGAPVSWQGMRLATISAPVQITADANALTLGSAGIDMSAASQNLYINTPVTVGAVQNWNVASGRTLTAAGAVAISSGLTVNGAGNVVLGAANTGSGGVTLSSGTLTLNNAASAGVSTTLTLNGGTLALNADPSSGINVAIGGPVQLVMGANRVLGGNSSSTTISGAGTLTFSGLTSGRVFTFSGNMSGFTGTVDLGANGGQFRFNSGGGNNALGNASATFNLGSSTGSLVNRNGGVTISLGALSGGSSTTLSGRSNGSGSTSTTYSIGGLGVDTTFAGIIANGGDNNGVIINKVGGGKLTLTGTSTYTGATSVNAGTLQVDGNLNGAGVVTVGASGKLAGIGKLTGASTVNGELAPGDSGIGTLNFVNALNLAGLTTMEIDAGSLTSDLVNDTSGTVNFGGTLTVQNLSGTLAVGESFNIFDGALAGSFATINLPSLADPGLQWDLSQLSSTGVISVQPVPEPAAVALFGLAGLLSVGRILRRKS